MRKVSKPTYDDQVIYQLCLAGISITDLKNRLNSIAADIHGTALDYEQKAQSKSLFLVAANHSDENVSVMGEVTKKELKQLYVQYMVPKLKPARTVYDEIIANAPFGKCPLCGFGHVYTLDHYLPKAKFPFVTVLPINLVPACRDCNTGKKSPYSVTASDQSLHPYYDHGHFIDELWLYASLQDTLPATLKFFVQAPNSWDPISKDRLLAHFKNYNLEERLSVQSSDELPVIKELLTMYHSSSSPQIIREFLLSNATAHEKIYKNSWQSAMYRALANSDWYCGGGFRF